MLETVIYRKPQSLSIEITGFMKATLNNRKAFLFFLNLYYSKDESYVTEVYTNERIIKMNRILERRCSFLLLLIIVFI